MRISLVLLALALAACGSDPDAFDDRQVPDRLHQPILEAIATVNADAGSRFRLQTGGDSSITFRDLFPMSGYYHGDCALNLCGLNPVIEHHAVFDIDYLSADHPPGQWPFSRIAKHEFGHAAGLGHVCDNTSYMYSPDACP